MIRLDLIAAHAGIQAKRVHASSGCSRTWRMWPTGSSDPSLHRLTVPL